MDKIISAFKKACDAVKTAVIAAVKALQTAGGYSAKKLQPVSDGLDRFFRLQENGTKVSTEIAAGLTTFASLSYIVILYPGLFHGTQLGLAAIFLAVVITSMVGSLIMGLVANAPYAVTPSFGLGQLFIGLAYHELGFTGQQALSMVFLSGLINIVLAAINVREKMLKAIPRNLQRAIRGGIGILIAYMGIVKSGLVNFSDTTPALSAFKEPELQVFLVGLVLAIALTLAKVKGAILITILATTLVGIPFGVTKTQGTFGFSEACKELPNTFLAVFKEGGITSLFADTEKLPQALMIIFSLCVCNTFDTVGTLVGTGKQSGLLAKYSKTPGRLNKAMFADAAATSVGALMGTCHTSVAVENAVGIDAGGRTGLTSVVVAICFALSAFMASAICAVPVAAVAPVMVIVGIKMLPSFKEIEWGDLAEAIPVFFTGIFMALCYSISHGIAAGFVMYCLVKVCCRKANEVKFFVWVLGGLSLLTFIFLSSI